MSRPALATRLETLRVEAGLSQLALSRASGISASHISQVERGRARPSPRFLERVAAALGLALDDLLDGIAFQPNRPGPRPLRPYADELRRHFRPVPPARSMATVRVVFKLAGYTRMGEELLGAGRSNPSPATRAGCAAGGGSRD